MTLPVPKLDKIDFERLVKDARGLIPRYAPDWTDHNLHDPGITLIDLLAWVADQEIYRIGFVGDSHRRAFAALLGVRPRDSLPARGLIWPEPGALLGEADLPSGARVTSIEQPDIDLALDTDLDLHVTAANETGLVAQRAGREIDLDTFNSQAGASLTLSSSGSAEPFDIRLSHDRPLVTGAAAGVISLGVELVPLPGAETGDPHRWGPVAFDYQVVGGPWQPVDVVRDDTYGLARTGVVLLRIPGVNSGDPTSLRLRLDRGFYPVAPKLVRLKLNVLPIVQLKRVAEAVIARSDGLPDQDYPLDLGGLPDASEAQGDNGLKIGPFGLQVEEGGSPTDWVEVDSFERSGPGDPHYVRDSKRQRIRFGNGVNGRIPRRDAQIGHRPYHVTSGDRGNLGSDLNWRVAGAPQAGPSFGSNPERFTGGADAWGINELLAAARSQALDREALLTNGELQATVLALPGFAVGRAEVLPRYNPAVPAVRTRHARTVVVVPSRDVLREQPVPVPAAYLDSLVAELAPRRVLGERLFFIGPTYVRINVSALLLLGAGTNGAAVRERARERLKARFSDLRWDEQIEPWPLGRPVTRGEVKGLLAAVTDVVAVKSCHLARAGAALGEADLELAPTEIAIAQDLDLDLDVEFEAP